jgi:hypothetical protein
MGKIRKIVSGAMPKMRYHIDPMSTHSDVLNAAIQFVSNRTKPDQSLILLEIGTGGKSSEIMRKFTEQNPNTKLISFENDDAWIEKYKKDYPEHPRHIICKVNSTKDWESKIISQINVIKENDMSLSFIDSAPWESRIISLKLLKNLSHLVLIHDVDYFPHNKLFGIEDEAIQFKPKNRFAYGKLKSKNLGIRTYDQEFKNWLEIFPIKPGYFTGPPTLAGSNIIDTSEINFGKNIIIQNKNN